MSNEKPCHDHDRVRPILETGDGRVLALRLPYGVVYARAQKLGCRPKAVTEKLARREERRAAPRSSVPASTPAGGYIDPARPPTPEETPPVLSPWIAPSEGTAFPGPHGPRPREDVFCIRVDQAGRIRAVVADLHDGWASWAVHDVTGLIIGKIGLRGGIRPGEGREQAAAGADAALVRLGWLPRPGAPLKNPCAVQAPVCAPATPSLPPGGEALRVAFGAAAVIAVPRGWTEEDFLTLARMIFRQEVAGSLG